MRSTTFDMVGMALMAVAVILTCGGMLMWGYLADARAHDRRSSEGSAGSGTPRSRIGGEVDR
jgi:hypothetical protein